MRAVLAVLTALAVAGYDLAAAATLRGGSGHWIAYCVGGTIAYAKVEARRDLDPTRDLDTSEEDDATGAGPEERACPLGGLAGFAAADEGPISPSPPARRTGLSITEGPTLSARPFLAPSARAPPAAA